MVAFDALVIGLSGLIFFYIGVSMGWLYVCPSLSLPQPELTTPPSPQTFMGTFLGSAVVPIALCVTWSKASRTGCLVGCLTGFACGLIAWLVTTATRHDGVVNVVTSGGDFEMLAGNLASIGVGGLISVGWSVLVGWLCLLFTVFL
jgi:Na+/proline symporter